MLATNLDISFTYEGNCKVSLILKDKQDAKELEELRAYDKPLDLTIKKYRKKRSLDANSYCWVIISKIADLLNTSKEELYIEMLKKYGQRESQLLSVVSEAVDMIYRATNNHCTIVGESELNGKKFTHLAILIGSSQYDSAQFSIFLDGIISEAKELGIETATEDEKNKMIQLWGCRGERV